MYMLLPVGQFRDNLYMRIAILSYPQKRDTLLALGGENH